MESKHPIFGRSLRDLIAIRDFTRKRKSSYDRTGGNDDNIYIAPGEKTVIFNEVGPGLINHIWMTQNGGWLSGYLRGMIIRIYWDNEETPSVECPLGDFFGMGHGQTKNFVSEPLQMSPQFGRGFNSWWPMPFKKRARIEIENDNPPGRLPGRDEKPKGGIVLYYYVDYESYETWPTKPELPLGYFHCQFRREDYKKDTKRDPDTGEKYSKNEWQVSGGHNTRKNGGYDRNHVILDAKGKGHYVGAHLNIYNRWRWLVNWPGEGDDMIFIDDDVGGEPTLYGTGTEDYVNTAWGPWTEYSAPYHGVIKGGNFNYRGRITYYRYHIQDPVAFNEKIKVTIEHGHNNHRGDIWETTAYWYQLEPHGEFPTLPDRDERMPKREAIATKIAKKLLKWIAKGTGYGLFVFAVVKILGILNWI